LDRARAALPPRSLFVAFVVGDDRLRAFLVPSDASRSITAYSADVGRDELAARVSFLRERLGVRSGNRGIIAAGAGRDVDAARRLFRSLFPEHVRAKLLEAERIILSPDGPLWSLPFAALVINEGSEPQWLGLVRPLTYAPSLHVLALQRHLPARRSGPVVIVGDPAFGGPAPLGRPNEEAGSGPTPEFETASLEPSRSERFSLLDGAGPPPRLPGTRVEAEAIAALHGVAPLMDDAATESTVRSLLPEARIVHLGTHGYLHPTRAMSSGLLLAAPAAEIPLTAELVVLSACETGSGQVVENEGLVGLTRALHVAGARSVVATQWQVSDASTARLMAGFHRLVAGGLAKDEALRRAMVDVSERRPSASPFHWAGFILSGDPAPLEPSPVEGSAAPGIP
jgi:CHAT domain-containing protein